MIPVTQTKVVIKNSLGEMIVRGNCWPAVVASILEVPITEIPNVEVLYEVPDSFHHIVMHTFLASLHFDYCTDDRFRIFHDENYGVSEGMRDTWLKDCSDKYYLVSGKIPRGFHHVVIYKNGGLVHDPHPTREGIETFEFFETIEKMS